MTQNWRRVRKEKRYKFDDFEEEPNILSANFVHDHVDSVFINSRVHSARAVFQCYYIFTWKNLLQSLLKYDFLSMLKSKKNPVKNYCILARTLSLM
jgi:hypothetical protein